MEPVAGCVLMMEELVLGTTSREFKHIERLGGVIGFVKKEEIALRLHTRIIDNKHHFG